MPELEKFMHLPSGEEPDPLICTALIHHAESESSESVVCDFLRSNSTATVV